MNKVMPGVCFMNKQMWELWFGMEIKMRFGVYEVENKEYGGFGFWISCFGFRVWGFEFGVSGLGVRDLGFRVLDFGFRVSCFGFGVLGI
ncbi:hypothetical protein Bca101_006744 [Brassica carinata]